MTFKPALWRPIAWALAGLNLVGVGFAAGAAEPLHAAVHAVLALGFGLWAQRLRRGPVVQDVDAIGERLDQHEDSLASQAGQLAELQERVDYAERMLIQLRDRPRPPELEK